MSDVISQQLVMSLILVIFVILISLIFKNDSNHEESDKSDNGKLKADFEKEAEKYKLTINELEKQKMQLSDEIAKQRESYENRIKQIEEDMKDKIEQSEQAIIDEFKKPIEALENYSKLFESGKLGDLNDELKYNASLIVKKTKQLKQLTDEKSLKNKE